MIERPYKSVYESSEGVRIETVYPELTDHELRIRLASYEQKYGMPFSRFQGQFCCCCSRPQESIDFMDWEDLVKEQAWRQEPVHLPQTS